MRRSVVHRRGCAAALTVLALTSAAAACSGAGADRASGGQADLSSDTPYHLTAADMADPPDGDVAGARSHLRHVVVLVKENRTFDSFFTGFPGADWSKKAVREVGARDVKFDRPPAPGLLADALTCGASHEHRVALHAWDRGKMDGFAADSDCGDPMVPFYVWSKEQLPNYWAYAAGYALFDNFRATFLGPSTPGHLALFTSQAVVTGNPRCKVAGCDAARGCSDHGKTLSIQRFDSIDAAGCKTWEVDPCLDVPTVVDELPGGARPDPRFRALTWRTYHAPLPMLAGYGEDTARYGSHEYRSLAELEADFDADAGAGTPPNIVYAYVGDTAIDDAPGSDPCVGENATVEIVDRIMSSPAWQDTAIVVTWDDWGGNYDHVEPEPDRACGEEKHFNNGFRLPLLLISPWAKRGVFHGKTEQASIPRFIEDVFGLPRMHDVDPHARDARHDSILGAFDFHQKPLPALHLTQRADCLSLLVPPSP